ncbi:Formate dehydrogenase H [Maioricimonas rarisocia]|uniref:nitrate reductase (cytochrome) n=1 Tax=Maioricimonas rarisocia TaxID=2528026 RepID=A0A517Z6A4_9PLAN|nr:formate dehydrogenase subunit alpha [Maioricimonas rarisocia]QDU37951.1 Formate dehydrogenase H [Maioricimonas rarisocia]
MADVIAPPGTVTLQIDGRDVTVPEGTTIWEAAREAGIEIPALCHEPGLDPVGVCRMCVVDVGERVMAASCVRECREGLQVETASEKVERQRRMLTRLLMRDYPDAERRQPSASGCELQSLASRFDLVDESGRHTDEGILAEPTGIPQDVSGDAATGNRLDLSSPVIAVDHDACILCDRCIRACDDVQNNDVIGRTGKGHATRIAFDLDVPMGQSTCVSCGECAAACPTDALTHKQITLPVIPQPEDRQVESVCPYCGVGCATEYTVRDNSIVLCDGRESPVNHERLCVKGRYGWDYTMHPQRLTTPLIRRDDAYPKGPLSGDVVGTSSRKRRKPGGIVDYDEVLPAFREATWEEALDLVAERLTGIRSEHGSSALAGFGSAKCSNEEAYLFQKLLRAGLGTNNVDHCTRLCHASSVAALMETIGSGAVTNVFADVANADVCLVTGSNTTANHPVAATFIKEAVRNGTKLLCVDPRGHTLTDFASHFAQIRSGSDVAFYNAVMHVLIAEGLIDEQFVAERTEGFDELKKLVLRDFAPEQASSICGIEPDELRAIARTIGQPLEDGRRPRMLVFWGMGISQHTHGTDNARCLISLCLLTGNVGKPGTGLHPLRGQNNVQGASDAGLIPMVYPDYQPVSDPEIRAKFERAWGVELDPEPGLTVVEIVKGALGKSIRGMYILGENPFLSDPNINKVRAALSSLDFLVVQDIFLAETAEFADVILPASSYFEKDGTFTNTDRRVQVGRKVLDSPGEARQDWQVICDIARRIGLPMEYASSAEVFDEFAALTGHYRGLTHENLGSTGKLWPCPDPEHEDGVQILFGDRFPTASGRGKLVPCPYLPADELPDEEYPLILNTGRVLEHWHTGSMTRRSRALDAIQPNAFVAIHPDDLTRLGIVDGTRVQVSSRRGTIELEARADRTVEIGTVFIPFHFREAAANVLTTDALDPFGKIPEFKFCAVRVEAAAESAPVST